MKNIRPLLLIFAGLIASGLSAKTLTAQEALERLRAEGPKQLKSATQTAAPKLQITLGNLYVFTSGEGFMILPGEEDAPALLGYSDKGHFEVAGNDALESWLSFYNSELDYLRSIPESRRKPAVPRRATKASISPLLTTEWNQEAPYNLLCPKVNGHDVVTGCVATAMAQKMKYHNYPPHGKGSHSYFWEPGNEELSFNYDSIPFQWDLMTDTYDKDSSEASRQAVAELMLGCGISVDMHYEPGDSGAATTKMGEALISIFGYSPSLWMPNRQYYGLEEWENMIYSDLAEGLPVLYSGDGTAGGHQFICDGYDGNGYFHFNWGWGGLSNGYFLLTALNPANLGVGGGAGGFNSNQIATLGCKPAQGDETPTYTVYNTSGFTTDTTTAAGGEDVAFNGGYYNFSLATLPAETILGVKVIPESDPKEVQFLHGPAMNGFRPDYGRSGIEVKLPELPDGNYTFVPVFRVDDKWYPIRMPIGSPHEVSATVAGNIATFASQSYATVEVTDIDVAGGTIYTDQEMPMPFKVSNTSDMEYYSTVTPYLLNSAGATVGQSEFRPLDIPAGEEQEISDYVAQFTAAKDMELTPGEYNLVFKDSRGQEVSDPLEVTVATMEAKTKISVTDFKLLDQSPIHDAKNIRFSFKVVCDSGIYYSAPRVIIFPGDGGYDLTSSQAEKMYLIQGESKETVVDINLEDLKDGSYQAVVYNGGDSMTGSIWFRLEKTATGIMIMPQDKTDGEIYDVKGIRLRQKPHGLYIENGFLRLRE